MKILIDNGHGIETAGKRSPDGSLREYLWARQEAAIIVSTLKALGYDAELLVPETNDIALSTRVRRVNKACSIYGTKNVMLISIHSNAAGSGSQWMSARGWCAFTCVGQTESDVLAEALYDAAITYLPKGTYIRTDKRDNDKDLEKDFYIIKRTNCKAVLTENLFQDNREDCAYLLSDVGRETIAKIHVAGIVKYLEKADIVPAICLR